MKNYKELVEEAKIFIAEAEKFDKNQSNKASSARLRKSSLAMGKLGVEARKELVAKDKE